MRDDLAALNLGQADREYDNKFFYRTYRDIELFITRLLSKGPLEVSNLTADTLVVTDLTTTTLSVGGVPFGGPDDYLKKSGGIMTGDITLAGAPTSGLHAATKTYVDAVQTSANTKVAKAGDTMTGSLTPAVTNTINLGSAALRWATVFTADLSLSNGIGDWTIVEGEDDLFLYNNKKGKTYKFALIEVETAPPKKV